MQTALTKVTVPASYSDPELEALYDKTEAERMPISEIDGKHDGKSNLPTDFRMYRVQVLSPLASTIQSVIDLCHAKHQTVCDDGFVQRIRKEADARKIELGNEEKAKAHELEKAKKEEEESKCDPKSGWWDRWHRLILVAFAAMKGALTYLVLKRLLNSWVLSTLFSIAVFFVAGAGLHVGAGYIASAPTPAKRKGRYALVLGAGLLFSIILGYGRGQMSKEAAAIDAQISQEAYLPAGNAWPFVLISFLAFWVALALELKFHKSPEEKARIKAYEEKKAEVKRLEGEMAQIQNDIQVLEADITLKTDWIFRRQIYARDFEIRLRGLAQKIADKYESTNVDFRTDRQCPPFFGEKIDFGLTLYYQNLFEK